MRLQWGLGLLLCAGMAWAESSGAPVAPSGPGSEAQPVRLEVIPPTDRLAAIAFRHCIGAITVSSLIDYDGEGAITQVTLQASSGAEALDRALHAWLGKAKVTATGRSGKGWIPFKFSVGEMQPPSAPTDPIRDCDMLERPTLPQLATALSAFGEVAPAESLVMLSAYSGAESPARLVLTWDDAGRVVRITIPGREAGVEGEQALATLAEAFRMRPGHAGEGYLIIGANNDRGAK